MDFPAAVPAHPTTATEFFFLEACGNEGRRWRSELESHENNRLRADLSQALRLLRAHQLHEGRELLASVELDLRAKVSGLPSIGHFLWRYVFSTKAYLQYLSDDFKAARASLEQADDEIRTILELNHYLLPLAIHCTDFIIQQARIARREGKWTEVKRYIDNLEQIATGESPYCVLRTGKPIRLADLEAFFDALPLSKEQRDRAYLFLQGDLSATERIVRISERIFTLPDMVIPYP
jgi:hypothetical protein